MRRDRSVIRALAPRTHHPCALAPRTHRKIMTFFL
jgi:hypothetical protein